MKKILGKNLSFVQLLIMSGLILAIVYSNIISGRQLNIFNITMTGGTFIMPLTYVFSDLLQEVYGYKWSRISSITAFVFNAIIALLSMLFVTLPYPTHFTNAETYQVVLGNTPRILVASLIAFYVADLVNDKVFQRLKENHDGHDGFIRRALLSSVAGQLVDGFIFNTIGFIGEMPLINLIISIPAGIILSILVEVVLAPLTKKLVYEVEDLEINNNNKDKLDIYKTVQGKV